MTLRDVSLIYRARDQIREDLHSDRRLQYILLIATFVAAFWFWWRIPNFATSDEYRRIGQPMKVGKFLLTEPGFDSIQRAAEEGVGRDATTYLHGIALLPLFIAIVLLGEMGTLINASGVESIIGIWNTVPAWFWASALLITRLLNVILVVCIVYVTYRIGTVLTDRQAGRIAALFTSLSIAVIQTAHEVNEDTPALLLLLLVLYLSILYFQTHNRRYFFLGCALGGLAIAFKLTAGVAVIFLGCTYFFTTLEESELISEAWQPRLLLFGLLLGIITIYVGIPNLLLRGPEWLIETRIIGENETKAVTTLIPRGYSALLAYLNGLGLPLTIATIFGLYATVSRLIKSDDYRNGETILLAGLVVYLIVFFGVWRNFRTHHVLPSIPLLILPFGISLSRYFENHRDIAQVAFIVVLLTTALYAGAGLYKYTNAPEDEAADWLESNADSEATVTVFGNTPAPYGLVHGRPIDHYNFERTPGDPGAPYTEWLLSTPSREPEYIQTRVKNPNPEKHPRRAEFHSRLIEGDHHGYVVAAEFGERPQSKSRYSELLYAGIEPKIEKRTDHIIIFAKNETLA